MDITSFNDKVILIEMKRQGDFIEVNGDKFIICLSVEVESFSRYWGRINFKVSIDKGLNIGGKDKTVESWAIFRHFFQSRKNLIIPIHKALPQG